MANFEVLFLLNSVSITTRHNCQELLLTVLAAWMMRSVSARNERIPWRFIGCGSRSKIGGIMANLRVIATNKFHWSENLGLIITGQVKAEEVFAAMEVVEQNIAEHVRI